MFCPINPTAQRLTWDLENPAREYNKLVAYSSINFARPWKICPLTIPLVCTLLLGVDATPTGSGGGSRYPSGEAMKRFYDWLIAPRVHTTCRDPALMINENRYLRISGVRTPDNQAGEFIIVFLACARKGRALTFFPLLYNS